MSAAPILCWKCLASVEMKKVGFQSLCEACSSWLHCCKGCRHYRPGSPNDCMIPGTELVADREARNLCDEFEVNLKVGQEEHKKRLSDVERQLFGESSEEEDDDQPNPFDRLFKK